MTLIPKTHIWKLCERKKKYSSEKNALAHLRQMRKKGLIIPANASAYRCPIDPSHFHLGHIKL